MGLNLYCAALHNINICNVCVMEFLKCSKLVGSHLEHNMNSRLEVSGKDLIGLYFNLQIATQQRSLAADGKLLCLR